MQRYLQIISFSNFQIEMALTKEQIAERIARELRDGYYVNLGIGIPTLVANYIPEGMDVVLEIDIQGAMNIRKTYPKGVLIFILPPSMAELRKRITGRGSETKGDIELRMGEALKEIARSTFLTR